jgi:hippurate hydrolase
MHTARALVFLALLSTVASAQGSPPRAGDQGIATWLDQKAPRYLELYRSLHQKPELSLQERETSALVARELEQAGYRVQRDIGGFGVVGVLQNGPGRTLLLRGDMDALPVKEETGLAFASRVQTKDSAGQSVPVMHACGHDLHVTNLLATATVLAQERARWSGTLVIVAQPAEEIGLGAHNMIDGGLFQRVPRPDYALALHVDPEVRAGHVAIASGWAAANTDSVDVTLYGRGGHGSKPQDAVDPIVLAAQYVLALQTLVSRRNDPQDPAVITVGSLHAGTKHNIIPDSAALQITVRSYSDAVRKRLLDGIAQLARDLSTAAGSPKPPSVSVKDPYTAAVWNDPELAATALRVLGAELGADRVSSTRAAMSGEDFGAFGRYLEIPSVLMRLGASSDAALQASQAPGAQPLPTLHSSRFAPEAPAALRTGVRTFVALTLSLLSKPGTKPQR